MAYSDTAQKQAQSRAMDMQRFGDTRANILKEKGNKCSLPLQFAGDYHSGPLVIDHIKGGGRHDTERGMFNKALTHNKDNFRVVCQRHNGMMDRRDYLSGYGSNTKGNSNNPSQ